MLDKVLQSDSFRRTVADYPRGASEHSEARVLFKNVVYSLQNALENTGVRLAWNSTSENERRPDSLIIYDIEDDVTTILPVRLSKVLVEIGSKIVFLGHKRAVQILGHVILDEIAKAQETTPMA